MPADPEIARDDIFGHFDTVWTPLGHPVQYDGVANKNLPPTTSIPWARTTLAHVDGNQATLANSAGKSRFRHVGIFTVQVFTPLGDGGKQAHSIAKTLLEGFQGTRTTNGIWFRNVRINRVGPTKNWFQLNVLANFEYDHLS